MNEKKEKKTTAGHKTATAIGIILCIILIPMLAFNITLIVKEYINPDKVPDVFGLTPLIVQSGSMETEIHTGDLVFVKRADTESLLPGDIIAFKTGDVVVTHRIFDITVNSDGQKAFVTKGDANNTEDLGLVTMDMVVGKYCYRVPLIGDIAMFMQTPTGILCFVGIPVVIFIAYDIIRRKKSDKNTDEKTAELEAEVERLKAAAAENDEKKVNK